MNYKAEQYISGPDDEQPIVCDACLQAERLEALGFAGQAYIVRQECTCDGEVEDEEEA